MSDKINIEIEKLYNDLLNEGFIPEIKKDDYEVINLKDSNYEILTIGNKYVKLVALSRHKTDKHLIKFIIKTYNNETEIITTTDHVCMILNDDHFFENKKSSDIKMYDMVSVYDEDNNKEVLGTIISIIDLGKTSDYVYDCEVDDKLHSFYANNVLIHNSQFVNLECITNNFKKEYSLCDEIYNWSDEDKLRLWSYVNTFVEMDLNKYIQDLVSKRCFTENAAVLRYSLEYIGSVGIYEKKKHYAVHKTISEGPELVDKTKFTGIELKKRVVPKQIKPFLAEIYNKTLTGGWNENNYRQYISELYEKFLTMDITEIALWKGYNTERQATGFLTMELGTTGIGKACNFYNQLIKKLGIGDKYDEILLGDQVQFIYLNKNNIYGIECIAFKNGVWPKEFAEIFEVDYNKMFEKVVLDSLKGFLSATKFKNADPRNQMVEDIFSL